MEGNSRLEQEKRPMHREGHREPPHRETKELSPRKEHSDKNKEEFKYFKKPFHKKKPHFHNRQEANHEKIQKEETPKPENPHRGDLDIKQASATAKQKLAEALDKKANTVVSVSKEGENWDVIIEIIDEEYLPGKNLESMNDIIGVYDVKMSDKGELLSWNKKSSRRRGNTVG